MASLTFLQMQTRLNDRISGYGNLTFPDARKKYYLNDGYVEFARISHILWKQSTITIAVDDALYAFPTATGGASVNKIWRATWDGKVLPVKSTAWMDKYIGTGWRDTKTADIQYVLTDSEDRSQIRIYPMIDLIGDITGKTFYVEYSYLPSDMSSDSDTCALPAPYDHAPIEYAVSMCLEDAVQSKQNPMMGDRALQNFWRYVGAARTEVHLGKFGDSTAHVTPPVR